MMKNRFFWILSILIIFASCDNDDKTVGKIFDETLSDSSAYYNLQYLADSIGGRLACSPEGIRASMFTKEIMEDMQLDNVFLQEAEVKNWDRGDKEVARFVTSAGNVFEADVCALGRGIGTGEEGVNAKVVEVKTFEELAILGKEKIEGKIVFFNQPMNPDYENTFRAYGEVARYRFDGPIEAAKYGAKGAIIRSLTSAIDDHPHTGVTRYAEDNKTVPAVAITTMDAGQLSAELKNDPELEFYFRSTCKNKPDTIAYNVIGEIKGAEFPNKIITVGGHLDAWDNSPGAHDDGAGCMQSIDVLRIFKALGIQPRHTIRAVMFMDEEISQGGGRAYALEAKEKGIEHIFAIESDRGVDAPLGFSIDADEDIVEKLAEWKSLFEPYGVDIFVKGGSGVDISPLKEYGTTLVGLLTDPALYFNYHHSPNDTFDKINFESMQKGTASMAALIYLVDKHGVY